jgi:hypothetical protein
MIGNQSPNNNIIQQFNQFKKSFSGNPQQMIQQMLNSGKITQEQYNQAVQKANMLKNMLGIR